MESISQRTEKRTPFAASSHIIASSEGVQRLTTFHPDVPLYLAAIDDHLNESGLIVPGLGNAGDRQFGTG